jgi:hypothetical protein
MPMSIEEYVREMAALDAEDAKKLEYRYSAAFPNDPLPLMYWWRDFGPQLDALMEDAIKRGRALTVEDLCKAQNTEPPPPGAVV